MRRNERTVQAHRIRMKNIMAATFLVLSLSSGAIAATVTNAGSGAVVLVVVENGNRMEISIDAGSSEQICPSGCFVTLPNGDRVGLEGGETVEIKDGAATIR